MAACQGLALPGGRPLAGVSSAAALAFAAASTGNPTVPVAVVGDARRDRLWCAVYALDPGTRRLLVLTGGQSRVPAHTADDFMLTGWDHLARLLPPDAQVLSPDWERIGAGLAGRVPAERLAAGPRFPTAPDVARLLLADPAAARAEPIPIYLHPAVAGVAA